MHDKEKDLFQAFMAGKLSRRELFDRTAKTGIAAAAAHSLLGAASTSAMAADFDWMKFKGKSIKLLLNKHPYADAMIADIESFKKMTGMDVSYDIFPGGRVFRQGHGSVVVEIRPVRRLYDGRLHDLDLWPGRLGRGPQALPR